MSLEPQKICDLLGGWSIQLILKNLICFMAIIALKMKLENVRPDLKIYLIFYFSKRKTD